MEITPLSIEGAFAFTPVVHDDDRGAFLEWFRADKFREATGHELTLAQANMSVSTAGTLRGIHFAQLPPSQAKYVTCITGAILDVVVDIRVGSPTFGAWEGVRLDRGNRKALYLSEGLGHAFMALEPDTIVAYLCSAPYAPGREHGVHPLDPEIGIEWPTLSDAPPLLSPKDETAPSLREAKEQGLLPTYDAWTAWVGDLRQETT